MSESLKKLSNRSIISNIEVSVILTTYNRIEFLEEAIDSILASTFTSFEFIIVDDNSNDGTYEFLHRKALEHPIIQLYQNEIHLGEFRNRNVGANYSKGKYLKYVDSDDLIFPNTIEQLYNCMEAHPDAGLGVILTKKTDNKVELFMPSEAYARHFFGEETLSIGPSSTIIRKDVFNTLGGFANKRFVADSELWLRIAGNYPVLTIHKNLVVWRRHKKQEFNIGMQSGKYLQMTYPIYIEQLTLHKNLLKDSDWIKINSRLNWKHARDILSLFFRRAKFSLAIQTFLDSNLTVKQLLIGFKSYESMKKYFLP